MMAEMRTGGQEGFTLVEMMMVLLIIGILVGIAFVSYSFSLQRTRETACHAKLRAVTQAISMYEAKNQTHPPSLQDLVPEYLEDGFDFRCPQSGQEYTYDPVEVKVSCPYDHDL